MSKLTLRRRVARPACRGRSPHPTSVTIAIRPSCERGMAGVVGVIWGEREAEYFFQPGWTGFSDLPVGQSHTTSHKQAGVGFLPSPLVGEGAGAKRRRMRGSLRKCRSLARRQTPHPSRCRFAPAIHLLPQGEKGRAARSSLSPSLRANGSRECAPDDRLREAIHTSVRGEMDCFVASLLAMTAERPARPQSCYASSSSALACAGATGIGNFSNCFGKFTGR
jgi:hypothetical protein